MQGNIPYQAGQRWKFKTEVAEFENTLVIGKIIGAHPEWGWPVPKFEVYVKYSALGHSFIPDDYQGAVLSLTEEGLDRSVEGLLESGVKLPWWWVYGRRYKRKSDASNSMSVYSCDEVHAPLPLLFRSAKQAAEIARQRAVSIQRHNEKFPDPTLKSVPSSSVAESWTRIKAWFQEHAPGYSFPLNAGASESAIDAFEKEIQAELPDSFKDSVRIHDGGDCWILPSHGDLLSLDRILQQWKMYSSWVTENGYGTGDDWIPGKLEGPIKPVFWNQKRIYITDNSGDHLTLDLDPPADGVYGQIIDHSHEVGPQRVVARSWGEFLNQLAQDLESGKYVYFEHEYTIEPRDSLA